MVLAVAAVTVFLLFAFAGAGSADVEFRSYPFPLPEVEDVISRWLHSNGFEIVRACREGGQVHLGAMKEGERWQIMLKPRSPLASEVQAEYFRQGQPDQALQKELWAHLQRYARNPAAEQEDYGVPSPVLAHSESVVCIKAERGGKPIQFSGFIIDREGLILGTAHDLEGIQEVRVILDNGHELNGQLCRADHDRDLALIAVKTRFDACISLSRGRNLLSMGEKVFSIGCPVNLQGTVHAGFIDGPPRKVNTLLLWQVNMEVLPGSSGSPVFDTQGNVVAVVKGRYRGTDSVGFLIPMETIREFMGQK